MTWDPGIGQWQPASPFPNYLTLDKFISIEDLIERIINSLDKKIPFALARFGDGENRIIEEGRPGEGEFRHVGNFLTLNYYTPFRTRFLAGVLRSDVLGFYPNDWWSCRVIHNHELAVAGKPLVYAWCNRHWNARREWADEVLNRHWRTVLVGNRMPEYQGWLKARGFKLDIIGTFLARDYPDVDDACAKFAELKPELVLASAGWHAPLVVEAGKIVGAVAIDYGHCPDYHLDGHMIPNTCCPRGMEGCRAHYAHGNFADAIHQDREIKLPGE